MPIPQGYPVGVPHPRRSPADVVLAERRMHFRGVPAHLVLDFHGRVVLEVGGVLRSENSCGPRRRARRAIVDGAVARVGTVSKFSTSRARMSDLARVAVMPSGPGSTSTTVAQALDISR